MEPGPTTVRADTPLARLRERLERGNLKTAVITDPEGRLLGIVRRADLPAEGQAPPGQRAGAVASVQSARRARAETGQYVSKHARVAKRPSSNASSSRQHDGALVIAPPAVLAATARRDHRCGRHGPAAIRAARAEHRALGPPGARPQPVRLTRAYERREVRPQHAPLGVRSAVGARTRDEQRAVGGGEADQRAGAAGRRDGGSGVGARLTR